MTRISDLANLETPADNMVFPISDGSITKKITLANIRDSLINPASTTTLGVVRAGQGLTITDDGVLSVRNFSGYTLPPATADTLGGVRIGNGLTISETSILSVTPYSLPTASSTILGGVKIGAGLSINNGIVSVSTPAPSGGATGSILYQVSPTETGFTNSNITTTTLFLAQTGNGTTANIPIWTDIGVTAATANTIVKRDSASDIYANTFQGTATSAKFADLAEKYISDAEYEEGTVVVFGGLHEITVTVAFADTRVAGVISANPAYLMNSESTGQAVALRGKVPVKVLGLVRKGDLLVTSNIEGYAIAAKNVDSNAVFAKSLQDKLDDAPGTVVAVIL